MKKQLTGVVISTLSVLFFSGCATAQLDTNSVFSTDQLPKKSIFSVGADGSTLKTKYNIYSGAYKFYQKTDKLPFDEKDKKDTNTKKDNIKVIHLSNGKTVLVFNSGTIAYGDIMIKAIN